MTQPGGLLHSIGRLERNGKDLLSTVSGIQGLYEDIVRTLDDKRLSADVKLNQIRKLNKAIGRACGRILPG